MALSKTQLYTLSIPALRLVSESNVREHWTTKHRRAKAQRSMVYCALVEAVPSPIAALRPLTITITRVAPRFLDEGDNLPAACKHTQDGIADWLSGQYLRGQDRQPGLRWLYAQRRGAPKEYAVDITFQPGMD